MSLKYLNLTGLSRVITNLKNWVVSRIPTKTSEITNDSGFITSSSLPTVNNATLTIQKNGTNVQTFTANASSNKTANITVPTAVSELTNDSGFITSSSLPTVNNATLTIQKNGTTVKTFTANASSNVTCNITVPTKTSELTNDSGYLTAHQTVSNSAPTLAWGTTSTIGTIGGTALTVKMPANPNTNTTYSAGTGLSLSGTTFSLALTKALVTDALGYTPPTQDTNTDTKVTQTVTTGNTLYPVLTHATATATATVTDTARFSKGAMVNARYGYFLSQNPYDTAALKGTRPTSTYLCGALVGRTYDGAQIGQFRSEMNKGGYNRTFMQVTNYITNGAVATDGTATTASIIIDVLDDGSKRIITDGLWLNNLTPIANNTYTLGTSSLRWKAVYSNSYYLGTTAFGDIVTHDASEFVTSVNAYLENNTARDANTIDKNGITYYNSNGPATSLGASTTDGALFTQFYNNKWIAQIAQDYRNGNLFTRGKNNNTWQAWKAVAYHGDNVSKFTNDAGYLTSHQSLSNYSTKANTVKSLSISGKTITVTPGSGNTYTLTTQDTVYTHPTSAGNKHIPSGGSSGQILKYSSSGTAVWADVDFSRKPDTTVFSKTAWPADGTSTVTCTSASPIWIFFDVTGDSSFKIKITLSNCFVIATKMCVGSQALKQDTTTYGTILDQNNVGRTRGTVLAWPWSTSLTMTISSTGSYTTIPSFSVKMYQ